MKTTRDRLIAVGLLAMTWIVLWRVLPMRVRMDQHAPDLPGAPLRQELAATYGPPKYSMGPEEAIIRDILHDRRDGFFVDVGAADARVLSNTYFLESERGWRGLAVDPQTAYAADYARFRPRTIFLPFFVSERSDARIPFYIADQAFSSSADKAFAAKYTPNPAGPKEVTVSTIRLDDLLEREHVARIDLLSIDVEHHEPAVLAGFTIDRWRPALVCIEVDANRQAITEYFARHQYVLLTRYIQADLMNFYFVPLDRD